MINLNSAPRRAVKIQALKYDGSLHRSWQCELVKEDSELWTFIGVFEQEIRHPLLGVIEAQTVSVEFYWKNRPYNIFRFHEPAGGELRNFYCNVNLPPTLSDGVLSYIDLDIDVLVAPDLSYQVLDLDEFAENTFKHSYPPEIKETARQSLADLIELIENRRFPFDFAV